LKGARLCIEYRLKLKTPVHIGTGVGGAGFLDSYTYRENGIPIIPGSTIKGRLRAAVRALAGAGMYGEAGICRGSDDCSCLECLIFGRAEYRKGCLCFDDARPVQEEDEHWLGVRSGIGIDRYRRVARDGALYTVETAGGENLVYRGRISGAVPEVYREQVIAVLKDAFAYNYSLGFGKSRGLGWFQTEIMEEKQECSTP